jgi:methylmalonyl-CoA mutase
MTDPQTSPNLADGFPPATRDEWRKLVDAVLKGAPFDRLRGVTYDGLRLDPLAARRNDACPIAARADATPWQVLARIDQPDLGLANAVARHELANGARGLSLVFAGAIGDYGYGLPPREEALARVLEDIDLSADIAIELDLPPHAEAAVDAALARGLAVPLPSKQIRLGHDPLGAMALNGGATRRWSDAAPHFARRLTALAHAGFEQRLAAADGRVVHNAGGSEAQELAFAIAVALAYLRAMETAAIPPEQGRRMIFFRLAADMDQFLTIAKFRALRKLWARVEKASGITPEPAFISAETAWRIMTQRDPHVNILRSTVAVFAAALGGADAISVLPFTAALGLPDDFARRIARNTQLILLAESNLAKVADPAAGAGAVEDLTDQLCRTAWTLFQEIEAAGGAAAALESGLIQNKVAAVHAARTAAAARLEDAFTGTSIFPAIGEMQVAVPEKTPPQPLAPVWPKENSCAPLPRMRLALPFEALRDASDRILAATGARPKVFLATLGTPADFTARATFARNFFEVGGIEAVSGAGKAADLGAAFTASGAKLACLCASDKTYEAEAAPAAAALKAAGARHLYLAGRPGAQEAALRTAGIQSFIYDGCDVVGLLEAAHGLIAS